MNVNFYILKKLHKFISFHFPGPTLLKANEDSLAAVLEIKFNNLVIEILIENYELIFKSPPGKSSDYV